MQMRYNNNKAAHNVSFPKRFRKAQINLPPFFTGKWDNLLVKLFEEDVIVSWQFYECAIYLALRQAYSVCLRQYVLFIQPDHLFEMKSLFPFILKQFIVYIVKLENLRRLFSLR